MATAITRFVDHKRVLGRCYDTETGALRLFDRYLVEQHITTCAEITPAVIDAFLLSRPRRRPRSFNHLRGVLARFFTWLVSRNIVPSSPVQTPTRPGRGSRIPFSDLLAQLSDRQWQDAFRAGGYEPAVANRFIRKLREKWSRDMASPGEPQLSKGQNVVLTSAHRSVGLSHTPRLPCGRRWTSPLRAGAIVRPAR